MTTSRDSILNLIRQALTSAHLPAAHASLPPSPASDTQPTAEALIDSFTREAGAVRAQVHPPASSSAAIDRVIQLLGQSNNPEVLAWADSELSLPDLGPAIRTAGFKVLDPTLPIDPAARRTKLLELSQATVGLTGSLAGLADTGSLALVNGPGRSRLASLLPPTHIALLPVSALLPTLNAFFDAYPAITQSGSNLVFITGPSRTSDIEMTPVFGVHGPKQLHIILIE